MQVVSNAFVLIVDCHHFPEEAFHISKSNSSSILMASSDMASDQLTKAVSMNALLVFQAMLQQTVTHATL